MQTANVMVALTGDQGNTVPRYAVTAAEIAVLRAIHGPDSVFDIEPIEEEIERSNREELERLRVVYGSFNAARILAQLYPGAAARVFENLDELDLNETLYKATERRKPNKPAKKEAKKDEPAGNLKPLDDAADDKNDGIEDMDDGNDAGAKKGGRKSTRLFT